MRKLTITLKNSGNFNDIRIEQDNRVETKKEEYYYKKHVDKDKSVNNIYWSGNTSIEKIYEDVFQEAYENYRQRLKKYNAERADSLKNTYYEQVKADQIEYEQKRKEMRKEGLSDAEINKELRAKPKLAYLTIIKLGDREGPFGIQNLTDDKILQIKRIMGEFMTVWQQKYPNMKLINVAVHLDEVGDDKKGGTVHMHITYCPMCDSYTKGQKVQNSMTGALKQMGYESDTEKDENGQYHLSIEKWQIDMRNLLESIINKHGYERNQKNKDDETKKDIENKENITEEITTEENSLKNIESEENETLIESRVSSENENIEKSENFDFPEFPEQMKEIESFEIFEAVDWNNDVDNRTVDFDFENNEKEVAEEDFTGLLADNNGQIDDSEVEIATNIEITVENKAIEISEQDEETFDDKDLSEDKKFKYKELKDAIIDGLTSLNSVDCFLKQYGITNETIGCDYGLELECLQEHFAGIIRLLEYYQSEYKEICSDILDIYIKKFKEEATAIGIDEDDKLYTIKSEGLKKIKEEVLE